MPRVSADNALARALARLIQLLIDGGHVCAVTHQPDSYLWRLLDDCLGAGLGVDVDLTECMFGSPTRAARRIRSFGAAPFSALSKVCSRRSSGWSCGQPLHAQTDVCLLDSFRTPPAQLLKRWAGAIAKWALTDTSRRRITAIDSGRVRRHVDRGESPESRKARRRREDEESTAGARNPSRVVAGMPGLLATASRIRAALLRSLELCPTLVDLHLACGSDPPRSAPSSEEVAVARRCVCEALGLPPEAGEQHNPSSPLRLGSLRS